MDEESQFLQKEQFFNMLVALDDDEDGQPLDQGRCASESILKSSRPKKAASHSRVSSTFSGTPSPRRVPHLRQARPTLSRTLSAPALELNTANIQNNPPSIRGTPPNFASSPVQPTSNRIMPNKPARPTLAELAQLPRAPGRRKKDSKIKLVPECHRIFKDLVFFFFPNNDTNNARRMRITKAVEYGATWVVEWCDDITHMVVDRNIQFDQMKSYLKFDTFPEAVAIVNENYPADCITYRSLIDHKQPQYQVQGHAAVQEKALVEESPAPGAPSPQPPQLKPAKKDVIAVQPTTPSRSEESSNDNDQQSVENVVPEVEEGQAPESKRPSGLYDDVLEEIISGTKHTEYLVSPAS